MSKILLDYVFPITIINPIPGASTAFLRQVCLVVKPKAGVDPGVVQMCTSMAQVGALTDNTNASDLFNAGMNRVFIMTSNDLKIADFINENAGQFFTILVSSDFGDVEIAGSPAIAGAKAYAESNGLKFTYLTDGTTGNGLIITLVGDSGVGAGVTVADDDGDIIIHYEAGVSTNLDIITSVNSSPLSNVLVSASSTAPASNAVADEYVLAGGVNSAPEVLPTLDLGQFKGVLGLSSDNIPFLESQAIIEGRCAFYSIAGNRGKSLCSAFGSLLSNQARWGNQQYVQMPYNEGVNNLGDANSLFESKISFVISDDEFGNRLALFACGKIAIVAPYVIKDVCINLQSKALQWINSNEPDYTLKEATLLEERLQVDVIDAFIAKGAIAQGTVQITLEQENFVANGNIEVAQPKALWRVVSEMRQTI